MGSYHVTGEITNVGQDTLSSVLVTIHFYDPSGNLVADSTCCYANPLNIDPGHTSAFDSFVMSNQISGKPVSYSANNFTAGNMTSAGSQPTFGGKSLSSSLAASSSRGGLRQIPSNSTYYPGNDASLIQAHVIGAKKDISGFWDMH